MNNEKELAVAKVAEPVDGEAVKDLRDEQKQEETDQLNTESISEDEETEMIVNDNNLRRSLTPCLDEKHPDVDVDMNRSSLVDTMQDGRKTEDLELISDDDMAEQNSSNSANRGRAVDKAAKRDQRPATDVDEFKRLSKTTKERNYRDKDRRSPSQKRARLPEKKREVHSPLSRSRTNRRKDLVRYDVRNVIEGRKQRPDKYGRDTTQKRSRSKSRSSSLSSLSPDEARRSRSLSRRRRLRSRSSLRHHRRGRESKSPARHGRSPRARVSRSPATRKRRSLSRFTISPSVSRSPTPALRQPPVTVGRGGSPERRTKHQSPSRMKNGRSEQRKKEERRALSPVVALPQRRRRRSSSTSPTKQSQLHHKTKSRYVEPEPPNKSWTPPLRTEDRLPETAGNFKVVVKNSGASKKEKKAKRRKLDKKGETGERTDKKEKKKKKSKQSANKSSKEVFTSGDNILVSVNFSSKRAAPALVGSADGAMNSAQTTIVTLPPSKDQIVTQKQRQEQRQLQRENAQAEAARTSTSRSGGKSRRATSPTTGRIATTTLVVTKNRRNRKVDAKPVAIIDLDGSPFRVMTPSPKAVIVLSDSDGEVAAGVSGERKNKKSKKAQPEGGDGKTSRQQEPSATSGQISKVDGTLLKRLAGASVAVTATVGTIRVTSDDDDVDNAGGTPPQPPPPPSLSGCDKLSNALNSSSSIGAMMDTSGPKTPPEPIMKFSMSMRSKTSVLRTANPLHDAREEEEEDEEQQPQQNQQQDQQMPQEKTTTNGTGEITRTAIPLTEIDPLNSVTLQAATNIAVDAPGTSAGNNAAAVNSIDQSSSANNSGTGSSNKIGPNTPPEPAPTSPDAYDPFEPTKSNSVSPVQDMDLSSSKNLDQRGSSGAGAGGGTPVKIVNSPRHKDLRSLDEHKGKIPVSDLVMKLLNSTAGHHHHMHHLSGSNSDMGMVGSLSPPPPPPPYLEKSLERGAESQGPKGITILSNVVIQSGKGADAGAQGSGKSLKHVAAYSTMNSTTTSYSIMKQMQTEAKRMLYSKHKATLPSIVTTATATTCTPTLTQAMLKKHNAECTLMDIAAESPYSPGSSDFDDLFEPPMETARIPSMPAPSPMKGGAVAGKNQAELFDSIFGSQSPPTAGGQKTWTPSKARKQQQSGRGHSSMPRRSSHNRSESRKC